MFKPRKPKRRTQLPEYGGVLRPILTGDQGAGVVFVGLLQGTLVWQASQSSSSRICSFGIRCVPGSPLERTHTFFSSPVPAQAFGGKVQGGSGGPCGFDPVASIAIVILRGALQCKATLDIDWPLMLRCWLMFFLSWSPGRSPPRSAVGLLLEAYCCAGFPGRSWP